jgi:hypothetical protein
VRLDKGLKKLYDANQYDQGPFENFVVSFSAFVCGTPSLGSSSATLLKVCQHRDCMQYSCMLIRIRPTRINRQ